MIDKEIERELNEYGIYEFATIYGDDNFYNLHSYAVRDADTYNTKFKEGIHGLLFLTGVRGYTESLERAFHYYTSYIIIKAIS